MTILEERLSNIIRQMSSKQQIHFGWLCAIRSLPFFVHNISTNKLYLGHRKRRINEDLLCIFRAVDIVIYAAIKYEDEDPDLARYAAARYADTRHIATTSNLDSAYAVAKATAAAVRYTTDDSVEYIIDTAKYTINAAVKNLSNATKFNTILFENASEILTDKKLSFSGLDIYEGLWDEFEKVLGNIGASYWARLYKNIFTNEFEQNLKMLRNRINLPKGLLEGKISDVASYLDDLEKGGEDLNEVRIIIMGDKGAGKTSLARRLKNPMTPMPTDEESTRGVDIIHWEPEQSNDVKIHLWDFAGHTITHSAHQFFLSERCIYIIVLSGRTEDSPIYWLNQVRLYGKDSKVFIINNLRDEHEPDLPIYELRDKYPNIQDYLKLSVKDDKQKLREFTNNIIRYIKSDRSTSWNKEVIPSNYYEAKKELEDKFIKENYISRKDFDSLIVKHKIKFDDNTDSILKIFTHLGTCLYYAEPQKTMLDICILNPNWITTAVYRVINEMNKVKKYKISFTDFKEILVNDKREWKEDECIYIFRLFEIYNLGYYIKGGESLVIPYLLPCDRPKNIPHFTDHFIEIRYKLDAPIPPDIISRFIVSMHKYLYENQMWRNGVVLKYEETIAIIRKDDRTINIVVSNIDEDSDDDKDATTLLFMCRTEMNKVFEKYNTNNKLDLEYGYNIEKNHSKENKLGKAKRTWIKEFDLKSFTEAKREYWDPFTDEIIDLEYIKRKLGMDNKNEIVYNVNQSGNATFVVGDQATIINRQQQLSAKNDELQLTLSALISLMSENSQPTEAIKEDLSILNFLKEKEPSAYDKEFLNRITEKLKSTGQVLTGVSRIEEYVNKGIGLIETIIGFLN